MAKVARTILVPYLICTDPVMVTKWQNILDSFWHKDDGRLITDISLDGTNIVITDVDGDGNIAQTTIAQYQEPANFPISKITDLQTTLNNLVVKVVGKGLSTEDFTTALKNKLDGLSNYVHPVTHSIAEIDGLQDLLDTINDDIQTLMGTIGNLSGNLFLRWNGYRLYKESGGTEIFPQIGDELKGRGDGRFENGEWVHCEVTTDNPVDDNDINRFTSYP